ncbi:MAG: SOS response-associated peptidase [Myxococcales bacterium]|nr:SOS response-associated peptidase [Myxococcales bacterium]MCB9524444.1 SOS response-associated peptidase [Myxococcales bacterium]
MCGRFAQEHPDEIVIYFKAHPDDWVKDLGPRYNLAPTQRAMVVRLDGDGVRVVAGLRWGLVPHWARDPARAAAAINARSETVAAKASFRTPFKRRRCVVPASRFYEWRREGRARVPHSIQRADGAPFAFAGLWDEWQPPDGSAPWETFTVLTTDAAGALGDLHDRFPATLEGGEIDAWLDPGATPEDLHRLLKPAPASALRVVRVSAHVNNARNDDPRCIQPPDPELF